MLSFILGQQHKFQMLENQYTYKNNVMGTVNILRV